MSSLNLRLPESLHEQIRLLAKKDNVSINQFIVSAMTEKMAAFLTRDYLEERAAQGNKQKFQAALAKVSNAAPLPADKIN